MREQAAAELHAIHAGHADVDDGEFDRGLGLGGVAFEKLFGAGIGGDLIAEVVEDVGAGREYDGVVVDDGGLAGLLGGGVRDGERGLAEGGHPGEHGQRDLEDGAAGGNDFDLDVAAVGGGDGFGGGEAEAGAFAEAFGGEERFEDVRDDFFGDAGAGVGELEDDVRGGLVADGGFGHLGVINTQGDGATVFHGITGVDHEVEEQGGEFVAVADDGDVGAGFNGFEQLDLDAAGVAHEARGLVDDFAQVEGLVLGRGAAGEGEEVAAEVGAAFGGLDDDLEVGALGVVDRFAQGQLAHGDDAGEDVVVLVGDAAGEEADGLEMFGLEELLARVEGLGDVGEADHGVVRFGHGGFEGDETGFVGDRLVVGGGPSEGFGLDRAVEGQGEAVPEFFRGVDGWAGAVVAGEIGGN